MYASSDVNIVMMMFLVPKRDSNPARVNIVKYEYTETRIHDLRLAVYTNIQVRSSIFVSFACLFAFKFDFV